MTAAVLFKSSHLEQVTSEVGLCKSQRATACACRKSRTKNSVSRQASRTATAMPDTHSSSYGSPIFTVFVAVALAITLQVLGRARTAGRVALHRAATEWSSEVGHGNLPVPLASQTLQLCRSNYSECCSERV